MRVGDVLGDRYRLNERIAAGGMGAVWRAHDDRLHRDVAVKVLHSNLIDNDSFRQRFHIEARAVASLDAEGIVDVYDFGEESTEDGDVVYIVMQLVDGRSLWQVLRERGPLSPDETMSLLADCADALAVAHDNGIVHRDIKPGNILIDSRDRVKIVDFGIARNLGHSGVTTTGMVMGTMSYVAPEQLRGDDPSPAGDVYSLGVVGYQCLSGRTPFDHDVPAAVLAAALSDQPPPLPESVPEPVAAIIMRALSKQPRQRWPGTAAMAAACRNPEAADASIRTAKPKAAKKKRRTRVLMLPVALVVVVVGGATVAVLPWLGGDGDRGGGASGSASDSVSESPSTTASESSRTSDPPTSDGGNRASEESSSSSRPENITMPDVTGKHMNEAKRLLKNKGLSNVAVNSPDGCWVKSQHPVAGKRIPPDYYIELGIQPEAEGEPCPQF